MNLFSQEKRNPKELEITRNDFICAVVSYAAEKIGTKRRSSNLGILNVLVRSYSTQETSLSYGEREDPRALARGMKASQLNCTNT